MSLNPDQVQIQLDTLYSVKYSDRGTEQLQPNIEVVGGTVNIYGSQQKPDSPPTGMYETAADFGGIDAFGVIPSYLYIEQASGTVTSIILTGVYATAV